LSAGAGDLSLRNHSETKETKNPKREFTSHCGPFVSALYDFIFLGFR
jgi:hypothetical protein